MNIKFKIALFVIISAGIGILIFLSLRNKSTEKGIIAVDTNIVKRYNSEIGRDTVFRFIDRLVNNQLTPQKIFIQKTDTVLIEKISKYDLPVRLEKYGSDLNLKTVNIFDTTVKEYKFNNLGNDFTLVPVKDNIIIKSKNYYLYKPDISFRITYPQQKFKFSYEIFSETGMSYKDKIFILAGLGYENVKNKFFISVTLKLKLL
jgi:hypothetical protein